MHYLQQEFYERFRDGNETFDFFKRTCLDGMWYWDLEHQEDEWLSPSFWRAFGYDPAKMPHKAAAWQALIHPDDVARAQESLEAHLADPACPHDVTIRCKHGKTGGWVWMRCRGVALRDETGRPVRMVGAHLDVTSLKETETLLRTTLDNLQEAQVDLEAALQAKTAFLQSMSHEIRTPMNGILGMTEALVMQDLPPSAATQVAVINRSARSLLSLLKDALDVTQLETVKARLKIDAIRVMDVIRAAVAPFEQAVLGTGRSVAIVAPHGLPERVLAPARAIGEIVGALVGNAVKYAQKGDIEVRVCLTGADAQGTQTLRVSVVDTGMGISEAQKAMILQRLAQSEQPKEQVSSDIRLDLVATRNLCQQHGGSLDVKETDGGGTTVEARLVVQELATEVAETETRVVTPKEAVPLRILVVEDDEMSKLILEALLSHVKAQIVFAPDGQAALALIQTEAFDAGFVELRMSVMSGTEFAKAWRTEELARGLARLPLIAWGGTNSPDQVAREAMTGFDRSLPKPITLDGFLDCINWIWCQRALGLG